MSDDQILHSLPFLVGLHSIVVTLLPQWMLQSFHHRPAQIAPVLREFLLQDGIEAEVQNTLLQALCLYESKNVDFTDALVAARMQKRGVSQIFNFDEQFDRLPGVQLGSSADPVEGVNSPETRCSAAAFGGRTACVFPSGPPYRDSYTSRFSAAM
jgi:predicted nucleic-acid-binding protein